MMSARLTFALRYGGPALLVLILLTIAVVPFSRNLVDQWSRRDVESRSRLVYASIVGPINRALGDGDQARLDSILQGVAQDERILALGLCDPSGLLRASTRMMPESFTCERFYPDAAENFTGLINEGRRVLVASFPISAEAGYLVVLHDLSYTDARSGQAQIYAVAALVVLAIIIAGLAGVLVLTLFRGWTENLKTAVDEMRLGRRSKNPRELSGINLEIQRLLKELDVGNAPTETPEVEWTPKALHDLLGKSLPGAEVIIISNREPYIHNKSEHGIALQTPASGLVSALEPVMRATGGTWIAHGSGTADRETVDSDDRLQVPPSRPSYTLRRVWISDKEQDGYYYGLANEGLWPLCHIAFVRPVFREDDWHAYEAINARFADAVAREARTPDPIVLVQDYHFALAPRMIRERLPNATIITFWHIPWPNAETFSICPWKERILDGLLGSSIIGFHTQFHCNNFLETVDRFIESRINRENSTVTLGGHETMIRPYPISIEWPPKALANQPSIEDCHKAVRARLNLPPHIKLGVGIERFDYTKGILDRMRSIDALLSSHPQWKDKFCFVQVAAPTRSKLTSYRHLQEEAAALAAEINARHGDAGFEPIRLLIRHHEPEEVFELFRAADLCVVSSLHDGMNLVAKEFVAARDDEQGVLILSTFAGASREMSEALLVNPYDSKDMADALDKALRMPPHEQMERMRVMRRQVREQNVYRWAGRMLIDAARIRQRHRILALGDKRPAA